MPVQRPTRRRVPGASRATHATSSASCVASSGVSVPVMIKVSIGPRMSWYERSALMQSPGQLRTIGTGETTSIA